ncbi:MAG TPA: GntR family transcriptional regulator [Gemmatimonadales bacterium]|nr:GntR family transcriptional regulator [Gemmatimonadales bacterium]
MFEHLDPRSPTPLYAQIANRCRVAIAAGELRSGAALPSVRHLAAQLRVNPATVVQAYRDLEADGFVEMRQGAGTFVREVPPEGRARERARQATSLVRQMLGEAGRLGVSLHELQAAIAEEIGVGTS